MNPFYTVVEVAGGFTIRFVEPPNWDIQEFDGVYNDPGEAISEFKKYERHQRSGKLTNVAFERRILHHRQDMLKLETWNND
jgi:hypothetical protein